MCPWMSESVFLSFVLYRCIRMALVHDLAESIVGDITPHNGVSKDEKYRRELVNLKCPGKHKQMLYSFSPSRKQWSK